MTKEINLPELEAYTKEQLAKKWECDISLVKGYIDAGQLKEALPPAATRNLRKWMFYRCADNEPLLDGAKRANEIDADDSSEWLLDLIEDGEMLEKYVGKASQEKIISCPKHLYIPANDDAIIDRRNPNAIKGSIKPPDLVRYFYDLRGNALIPLKNEGDGYRICFSPVEKHHLDSLIIRIEEIRRFTKKKPSPATVETKEERTEKKQEDSKNASTGNNNIHDKQAHVDDSLINIKEVMRRVNKSRTFIYDKMNKGVFPKGIKDGGRIDWRKSDIDDYVAGRWKPDE